MIMLRDKEKADEEYRQFERRVNYLSLVHSQPLPEKPSQKMMDSRDAFLDSLFDDGKKKKGDKPKKLEGGWSEETMRKMEIALQKEKEEKERKARGE